MTWFYFAIGSLATYRLSVMVSKESGPGFIFRKLRRAPDAKKHPAVKEGLSCIFCLSVWFSAIVTGYYLWLELITWKEAPIYWLAFSAVAVVLNQAFTKGDL